MTEFGHVQTITYFHDVIKRIRNRGDVEMTTECYITKIEMYNTRWKHTVSEYGKYN